jgi:hypothetical protein
MPPTQEEILYGAFQEQILLDASHSSLPEHRRLRTIKCSTLSHPYARQAGGIHREGSPTPGRSQQRFCSALSREAQLIPFHLHSHPSSQVNLNRLKQNTYMLQTFEPKGFLQLW